MRSRMLKILLVAVLTAALLLGGGLLYRHFVTDRIADKGGMENPYAAEMTEGAVPSGEQEPETSK